VTAPKKFAESGGYLSFSRDGRWLAVFYFGDDESIIVWDTTTWKTRHLAEATSFLGPVFGNDGTTLLAKHGREGDIYWWDLLTGRRGKAIPIPDDAIAGARASANGRVIALKIESTASLWDLATGKRLPQSSGPHFNLSGVCFGPHGRVVGWRNDFSGAVVSWDAVTGAARYLTRRYKGDGDFEKISPDERYTEDLRASGLTLRSTTPPAESKRFANPADFNTTAQAIPCYFAATRRPVAFGG
jgi:WD40 repeat protein